MPGTLYGAPQADPDDLVANAGALPINNSVAYGSAFARGVNPEGALHLLTSLGEGINESQRIDAGLGATPAADQQMTSEAANQQFGVDGYLRFNGPVSWNDAAHQQYQAQARKFDSEVLSYTHPNPLINFGASLAGGLVNPANLALAVGTDGLGEFAMGATGARAAIDATVASRVGRAALNVAGEGLVANAPFVALNAAEAADGGDPYSGGDALRDLAIGATLHTALHLGGKLMARDAPAVADPEDDAPPQATTPGEWAPPAGVPEGVADLPPLARVAAFAKAVDDMADDRPVDVGQYVDRELNPASLSRLDETSADPDLASFRPLPDDTGTVAVTPRGSEVPVRYGLAELADLTTSHDDALQPNPDYPPELQPRDRERAGAQARNYQLESELNPKLLMTDVSAAGGTPIVAPDGVVESGNGRAIALRRSAASGGGAYTRYRAELDARGYDTTGMTAPALVRMRTEPMAGAARAVLAREMNADVTERMSGGEQAMVDAGRIAPEDFERIGPNEGPATSRDFARAFIAKAAPDQVNTLTQADGTLSPEGARRIKAAVLARAYGDPQLVGQMFEGEEAASRQLAEGLADAAPAWARMRALAQTGQIPRELDLTPALTSAMDLARYAKAEGMALGDLLAERLGQKDMFSGEAVSPYTEAFLRLFHRDEAMSKPVAADKIAAALRSYARQAMEVTPGEDLFGDRADDNTARAILGSTARKYAAGEFGPVDARAPGRSKPGAEPRRPAVVDLRRPGEDGDGGRGDVSQGGGGEAGKGGGANPDAAGREDGATDQVSGAGKRVSGEQWIASDPELKALAEDTDRLAAENGLEEPAPADNQKPDTIAEAVRAAAMCLAEESE